MLLIGDIGGTKTLLAVARSAPRGGHGLDLVAERRYASADFPTFAALLSQFRREVAEVESVDAAGFGVAGPVYRQTCRVTNLPWALDARELSAALGAPVRLVNDFEAVGHALPRLGPSGRVQIQAGTPDPDEPIALLGAGTGLGEAVVLPGPGPVRVIPGEGGHADLATQSPRDDILLAMLRSRLGHVSWERVVSGAGIATLYELLALRSPEQVQPATRAAMEVEDPAAVVTARAGEDLLCAEALDAFLGFYGAEAGNLALRCLARGGVYLAGGIAPRLVDRLRDPEGPFLRAFRAKGRFEALLAGLPVYVVIEARAGLLGAAAAGESLVPT